MVPEARTTAFLFPGQGSQTVGMGRSLAQAEPEAAALFEQADVILGFPLSRICWEGPNQALDATENTQPALLVHSLAVWRVFQTKHPEFTPASLAGHSLGEFSALAAAGALSFEDALKLVRARGLAMKAAGQAQPGGMAAVLGLEVDQGRAVCEAASAPGPGGVWVANDNCPGQLVISGEEQALSRASQQLAELGARKVIRLAVSIAAHSPYMAAAQAQFAQALTAAQLSDPRSPVFGNVSAQAMSTVEAIKADLEAQLTATVRWTESVKAMAAAGVKTVIEMGPGSVLTGLVRRIDASLERVNLDEPESFSALSA
jgi:[acyl-carrier-protein] S-malonyltransferase